MDQLLSLARDRGYNRRMAVSQLAHGDTGQKVEVLVASIVPQAAACALDEQCGEPVVGPHQMFIVSRFYGVVLEHVWSVRWIIARSSACLGKQKLRGDGLRRCELGSAHLP